MFPGIQLALKSYQRHSIKHAGYGNEINHKYSFIIRDVDAGKCLEVYDMDGFVRAVEYGTSKKRI